MFFLIGNPMFHRQLSGGFHPVQFLLLDTD